MKMFVNIHYLLSLLRNLDVSRVLLRIPCKSDSSRPVHESRVAPIVILEVVLWRDSLRTSHSLSQ